MIVGMQPDLFLTGIAEREGLSIADALRGYAIEELLGRIYGLAYGEFLWLRGMQAVGAENYRRRQESCLEFYYVESRKYIAPGKIVPGAQWTDALRNRLQKELFEVQDAKQLSWTVENLAVFSKNAKDEQPKSTGTEPNSGEAEHQRATWVWTLRANYRDMHTPVMVKITPLSERNLLPEKRLLSLLAEPGKTMTVFEYSAESRLAEDFFEIMKMLELISDMAPYDRVNRILKTESVNGRHMMEELEEKLKAEPKLRREKRMEQLEGYRNYTYMKKRWQQYERRHAAEEEPWTEVMDRLLRFGTPIWQALCRKEVFFDDWMPELSRFLG
jgi:hypothetical protein